MRRALHSNDARSNVTCTKDDLQQSSEEHYVLENDKSSLQKFECLIDMLLGLKLVVIN